MLRWLPAGESHGPALVAVLEGVPADVPVTTADVSAALARRRLGAGRGARMSFERDQLDILGGVRHGRSLGSPVAMRIGNTEWPKWEQVMAAARVALGAVARQLLLEAAGARMLSHVVGLGTVEVPPGTVPAPDDLERIDA